MRLHIFNPETEYALATGASFYTPPASVEAMRRSRQLLPEAWADPDDAILVDDADSLHSSFRLVDWQGLEVFFKECGNVGIEPWGWNHALRRRLLDHGVPENMLPGMERIDRIRQLAHRRTTILLNRRWNDIADSPYQVEVPAELHTEEECVDFFRANPGCWMKAPWSSSGRGVINTAADMTEPLVAQWCRGIIRRQGSVLAETGADRIADHATEWVLERGEARYIGLSSFATSRRGKFLENFKIDQEDMEEAFNRICGIRLDEVVEMQKPIIESVLSGYDGLLGVDMIVEGNGALRPFVEVNLRRTMGMLYISSRHISS